MVEVRAGFPYKAQRPVERHQEGIPTSPLRNRRLIGSAAEAVEQFLPRPEIGESEPTLDGSSLEAIGIDKGHVRALALVAAQKGLEATDKMIAELAARRSRVLQAKAVRNQPRDSSNDNTPLHGTRGAQKQRRSDGN